MTPVTVEIPGAFDGYFSGSSIGQGHPEAWDPTDRGARVLADAYLQAVTIRRGRGYSIRMTGLDLDALAVLRQIALDCLEANYYGDDDPTEKAAARLVRDRCEEAIVSRGGTL